MEIQICIFGHEMEVSAQDHDDSEGLFQVCSIQRKEMRDGKEEMTLVEMMELAKKNAIDPLPVIVHPRNLEFLKKCAEWEKEKE